jgi:predicted nucleic acid-binding protein
MVIVDSSVWIDALWGTVNRHSVWLHAALGREQIALTSLILCEVLQGVRTEAQFRDSRRRLSELPVFDTFSPDLAVAAAQNYRRLRAKAITVRRTMDCVIATFCIENGHQLLHNDHDFDAFERHLGLRVLHPPAIPSI